jgi:hypothetical protein
MARAPKGIDTAAITAATVSAATAAEAAIALATKTAETAKALAEAKASSDISAAVLGNDISYIKKDIGEIKASFADLSTKYALKTSLDSSTAEGTVIHEDHETRIRSLERTATQTLTWGTVGILAIGVIEFLVIHFVK